MKNSVEFKGGSAGARVKIVPSMVTRIRVNTEQQGMVDIESADGKCQTVQGDIDAVDTALWKDS
jgi:hypothetical protein